MREPRLYGKNRPVVDAAIKEVVAGRPKRALAIVKQAQSARQLDDGMVLLTANIMDTVGDHDGAETLYRRLVRRTSGNIAALIDLGDALRRKGRAASARIFYKRALKSLRERRQTGELFVEAVGGMASVEMNLGKHERALKVIAEGLHECPWSGELLGTFGAYQQEYLRKGGGGARQAERRGRKRDV